MDPANKRHKPANSLFLRITIMVVSEPTVEQLFAETLCGDYDDDAPWNAVHKLRQLGTRQVFDIAAQWCASDDPLKRARGLDVLAQLGRTAEHPTNSFPDESYRLALDAVNHKTDVLTLISAIYALGHLNIPAAVPVVAPFHSHADPDIRNAVAFALGCFPNDATSVTTLLMLMRDSDEDVRDWATFAVGVLSEQDSPEIRDALVAALADGDQDVREEALVGLANRHDARALRTLLAELQQPSVTSRAIEAAYTMLGLPDEPKDWWPQDYVSALKEQFRPTLT